MDNYNDQIKHQMLCLKLNIKLREFVSFMFLYYDHLLILKDWIELLENQQKYSNKKDFFIFFKHIAYLKNEPVNTNTYLSNLSIIVKNENISDELILDILNFIDLKNYG